MGKKNSVFLQIYFYTTLYNTTLTAYDVIASSNICFLYNPYRPIFDRSSLQMAITKIKIISDATAAVLLKSCAAMYDVLIDKKFK